MKFNFAKYLTFNGLINVGLWYLILFLFLGFDGLSQTKESIVIKGHVVQLETSQALPYATILNLNSKKGTISNENGYFEIVLNSYDDSIQISYIGYQTQRFSPLPNQSNLEIKLKEQSQLLGAVEIRAKDYSYLLDLLKACKENARLAVDPSKAYFQLKSFSNSQQIELVENFYKAKTQGYHLKSLDLKVGRLGLRKKNRNIFASLESSKAIVQQNIFEASPVFPNQPMYLKKRQILKRYYLDLDQKYLDDEGNTIVVLKLQTKKDPERHFITKIWINQDKKQILKVNFKGKNLDKFPFIPLFEADSLSDRYLEVNKVFTEINGQMFLEHIDFNYGFLYHSPRHLYLRVKTNALLKFYSYFDSFDMPLYDFTDKTLGEYRIISGFPENDFFWNKHNELQLKDEIDSNSLFLENPRTLSADDLFNRKKMGSNKLFESRFLDWSERRIILRPLPLKEQRNTGKDFDIQATLFIDRNSYGDSIHLLSSSILDPYGSYFNKPLDSINVAFVNIYFDLVELERRDLMARIDSSDKSYAIIKKYYEESKERIAILKRDYFYETQAGIYLEDMEKYNEKVRKALGIDNFAILRIPKPSEAKPKAKKKDAAE